MAKGNRIYRSSRDRRSVALEKLRNELKVKIESVISKQSIRQIEKQVTSRLIQEFKKEYILAIKKRVLSSSREFSNVGVAMLTQLQSSVYAGGGFEDEKADFTSQEGKLRSHIEARILSGEGVDISLSPSGEIVLSITPVADWFIGLDHQLEPGEREPFDGIPWIGLYITGSLGQGKDPGGKEYWLPASSSRKKSKREIGRFGTGLMVDVVTSSKISYAGSDKWFSGSEFLKAVDKVKFLQAGNKVISKYKKLKAESIKKEINRRINNLKSNYEVKRKAIVRKYS